MNLIELSCLIPLLPLAGSAINGLVAASGIRVSKPFVHTVACGVLIASFILSCGLFLELHALPAEARSVAIKWFEWINLGPLRADAAFLIDPLSVVMCMTVTGVGSLIHVYSIGYMRHDPAYARFFAYFNLFCFAMLLLVLADNLLLMFVGWEGVGLCSYLLIGFWYDHKPNAVAGMKAFVVNRVGDFGFLIGLMILFWAMYAAGHPTLSFTELKAHSTLLSQATIGSFSIVTVICIFLFIGATGKSAQIPLYVWLPDAMAGPTPVSALIHAATMVTAGVYMIGRMNFLFSMSPVALAVVATTGALTAIFAATIGFAQNDIKKVLAYSTVSQLGYMFLGMGTGMYTAGIFHLVTHAFFKACLFLGAGSVILGMHHEQDIRKMGGLKAYMPITYWTFLAATFALSGIFPLAGFFSKDEILWQAFSKGSLANLYYILWGLGITGALCTAFYMMRLVSLTFFGKLRTSWDHALKEEDTLDDKHYDEDYHQFAYPYESSPVITIVLVALAVLSVGGGVVGVPYALGKFFGMPNLIEEWLSPVWTNRTTEITQAHASGVEYLLMVISVGVALFGMALAALLYTRRIDIIKNFTARFKGITRLVSRMYYVDEIYSAIIIRPLLLLNVALARFDQTVVDGFVNATGSLGILWSKISGWFDWTFVDGSVNAVANSAIAAGKNVRKIQTGKIQHYFYIAIAGLIALIVWRIL